MGKGRRGHGHPFSPLCFPPLEDPRSAPGQASLREDQILSREEGREPSWTGPVLAPALPLPGGSSDLSGYDVLIGDVSPFKVNLQRLPHTVPVRQLLQGLLQALVPLVHGQVALL